MSKTAVFRKIKNFYYLPHNKFKFINKLIFKNLNV